MEWNFKSKFFQNKTDRDTDACYCMAKRLPVPTAARTMVATTPEVIVTKTPPITALAVCSTSTLIAREIRNDSKKETAFWSRKVTP